MKPFVDRWFLDPIFFVVDEIGRWCDLPFKVLVPNASKLSVAMQQSPIYLFTCSQLITFLVIPMSVALRSYFKRKCFTLILFLNRVQFVRDTRRIRIRIRVEQAYRWLSFSDTRNLTILGICSILNSDWFVSRSCQGLLRRFRWIIILRLAENLRKIRIKCKVSLVSLFQVSHRIWGK